MDAWADTARHFLALGRLPLIPVEALRALWKRGGADRALAARIQDEMSENTP